MRGSARSFVLVGAATLLLLVSNLISVAAIDGVMP